MSGPFRKITKERKSEMKKRVLSMLLSAGWDIVLSQGSFTYNGKEQKPSILSIWGLPLAEGTDYEAAWPDNGSKAAGTYEVTVTGKGRYTGTTGAVYKIGKAANTLKVRGKPAIVRYSRVKKKTQILKASKLYKFTSKGQGKMTYKYYSAKKGTKSFKKSFKVNAKTGSLTVRKGLKKGTYKVTVKVKAAGNTNYKASSYKTVTITVRVK